MKEHFANMADGAIWMPENAGITYQKKDSKTLSLIRLVDSEGCRDNHERIKAVAWDLGYTVNDEDTEIVPAISVSWSSTNNRVGINQASPDADFQVKELGFGYGSGSRTGAGSSAVTVALFHDRKFKAAKLLVSVENTTDNIYETAEMVVTHDGTDSADASAAYLNTYGVVTSNATQQGTYDITLDGVSNNQNIQLQVTPTGSGKTLTVRVSWQALTI